MANYVKFKKGQASAYTALASKDADTLYFLTDSGLLYLGSKLIGSNLKNVSYASNKLKIEYFEGNDAEYNFADIIDGRISLTAVQGSGVIAADTTNKVATVSLNYDSNTLDTVTREGTTYLKVKSSGVSNTYNLVGDGLVYTLYEKAAGADSSTAVGVINIPKDQFLQDASVSNGNLVLTWALADDKGEGAVKTTSIPITDFFKGVSAAGDTYINAGVSTDTDGKTKVSVSVKEALWTKVTNDINSAVATEDTSVRTFLGFNDVIGTGTGKSANVKAYVDKSISDLSTALLEDSLEAVTSTSQTITVGAVTARKQNIEVNTANIVTAGNGLSVSANKLLFTPSDIVETGSALKVENGKLSVQWEEIS